MKWRNKNLALESARRAARVNINQWRAAVTAMIALLALSAGSQVARANRSLISVDHAYSWSENLGWMNWRAGGDGTQGVEVGEFFLQGQIWTENAGWIFVGDGPPTGALQYGESGEDYGVNVDINGDLFGWAWGENIGWVRFDTRDALANAGLHARVDLNAGRLRGYAWAENAGWINLDDDETFVQLECPANCFTDEPCAQGVCVQGSGCIFSPLPGCGQCAVTGDLNQDGGVTITDVQCGILTTLWALGSNASTPPGCLAGPLATADMDCSGDISVGDIQILIAIVLGSPLSPVIDANQNLCHDACE